MQLKDKQTLLFTGDSITDCGRNRPLGTRNGLGSGYVNLVNAHLGCVYPETQVRVLNTGIGGNTVLHLADRWQEDVIEHKPDWLSIFIGINDVWRQFDNALQPGQVDIETYRSTYQALIDRVKPQLEGMVLMAPYYLEPNTAEPMRHMMDQYAAVVRELAEANGALFVDVPAAFDAYLAKCHTGSLCSDRVHPNTTGHLIIAQAFLKAIGFDFNRA